MALAVRTPRLLLREWRDEDAEPFAAMSADPQVMQYLPLADAEWVPRAIAHWQQHGFGQWVVELPGEAPFIGVVGLSHVRFQTPFAPAVVMCVAMAPSVGVMPALLAASERISRNPFASRLAPAPRFVPQ